MATKNEVGVGERVERLVTERSIAHVYLAEPSGPISRQSRFRRAGPETMAATTEILRRPEQRPGTSQATIVLAYRLK